MMKFPSRKAQGALEYLQTYSWAILVVMIVGIALWQLGVFGGHGTPNTASGFSKIRVLEPSIKYSGDTLDFTVVNGVGSRAMLNVYNVTGDCSNIFFKTNCVDWVGTQGQCELGGGIFIPGLPSRCCFQGVIHLDPGETTSPMLVICNSLESGKPFEVYLTISYSTKLGKDTISHTDAGVIKGTTE